jgi:hypothetical protein
MAMARSKLQCLAVWALMAGLMLGPGCSCNGTPETGLDGGGHPDAVVERDGPSGDGDASNGGADGARGDGSTGPTAEQYAELWYSVDDLLVRIVLDESDGSVSEVQSSNVGGDLPVGQNALTMLGDGSLLGARLSQEDDQSYFYLIEEPPRDGEDASAAQIGVMPNDIMIEGLYSDCEDRMYAMDTGVDDTSSEGNRLLRFTGDVRSGDFSFDVVSDLSTADVADIDDMGPGIDGNQITDNPGFAIDTGDIYDFNYETGTGTQVATGGTYGIHALGGPLFSDGRSRLFVLSEQAELFEVDPDTFELSDVRVTGPTPDNGTPGWSGLAGPLTECESGFTLI